ncbi:MAG: metallophosphoesterase family protein [Clostridia bacterium]|nr:metallophosphoesterase family protein [Clostridia bacterium]
MNICFMCDLHLPFDKNALQYKILDWAIDDISKKAPDCIVYAGDVTCDGNKDVYSRFVQRMQQLEIPFLYIPGNSDLRCADCADEIYKMASPCANSINGVSIFAINDSDGTIKDNDIRELECADDNSIVYMHHPINSLSDDSLKMMLAWRSRHGDTMLFYGHEHKSAHVGCDVSLQALDPDKAIGENPCITYYNTDTKEISKAYYLCPVPGDLYRNFGVSCYSVEGDIELAIQMGLKNIELRPNCLDADKDTLVRLVEKWRKCGGEDLSIHLPDIAYADGKVVADKHFDEYIDLAKRIKANRFTQHVPVVAVEVVRRDKAALGKIAAYLAERLNTIEHDIVLGVENMHMTAKDKPDNSRRFGYVPEECIEFMNEIDARCRHKVGINFDIGHARNNAPYSRKYQISTWFSILGRYIVGYHMHQVTEDGGVFENHMPITDIYGRLISYASFFACWEQGQINKAPVIFEMRPEGAYQTTLATFEPYK